MGEPGVAVREGVPTLDWGVAHRVLEGETASGDTHTVQPHPRGMVVAVIDALGHGAEAAMPAQRAVDAITRHVRDPILNLLQRCHDDLVGTRGVVMSIASFDFHDRTMTWMGIGDVEGVLIFGDQNAQPSRTTLVNRGGIVGGRLPVSRPWVIPINDGDTLIFATDGIRTPFADRITLTGTPKEIADGILERERKGTDDALVLVARFRATGRVRG